MTTYLMIVVGIVLAVLIASSIPRLPNNAMKIGAGVGALVVLFIFFTLSSFRYIGPDEVGIVVKNVGTQSLPEGQIVATEGEKGPQAEILAPGWHPWLWPGIFTVEEVDVTTIGENEVGLITTTDGRPLPESQAFAPAWSEENFQEMLSAEYFLSNGGFKGPQTSSLKPGKYRLNTRLYQVETVPATNIPKATVGVVKSNVGPRPEEGTEGQRIVDRGMRGIWREPYEPSKLYLNTRAYEVTVISTELRTVRYTESARSDGRSAEDQREITVRSSDGFTFPVDVRIEYQINPQEAPLVVANFRDDGEGLTKRLNSVVRSVFRNNAESVKALDYVKQRSQQESQSLSMITDQMQEFGVTVTGVRIGDVGNEESLGELLKTQTDREIALQEQRTFQEQQRAAEQKKALTRTEQEAEEEKRLATAEYEVKISEQEKQRRIISAEAQAESIRIEAEAQARAFEMIAQQIGRGNSALIEVLKIVGERGVQITPRVMVVGDGANGGGGSDAQTTALIGTMLDTMVDRSGGDARPASGQSATKSSADN